MNTADAVEEAAITIADAIHHAEESLTNSLIAKDLDGSDVHEATLVHTTMWIGNAINRLAEAYEDRTKLLAQEARAAALRREYGDDR